MMKEVTVSPERNVYADTFSGQQSLIHGAPNPRLQHLEPTSHTVLASRGLSNQAILPNAIQQESLLHRQQLVQQQHQLAQQKHAHLAAHQSYGPASQQVSQTHNRVQSDVSSEAARMYRGGVDARALVSSGALMPGDDMWEYLDPQGSVQGPFDTASMRRWFDAGYFKSNLPLRQRHWQNFHPLAALFADEASAFRSLPADPDVVSAPPATLLSPHLPRGQTLAPLEASILANGLDREDFFAQATPAQREEYLRRLNATRSQQQVQSHQQNLIQQQQIHYQQQREQQLQREQLQREQQQREQIQREQLQREQIQREQLQREQQQREQLQREQLQREQLQREQLQREQMQREQLQREQLQREQLQREQLQRDQLQREQLQREHLQREQLQREQLQREQQQREQLRILEHREQQQLVGLQKQQQQSGFVRPQQYPTSSQPPSENPESRSGNNNRVASVPLPVGNVPVYSTEVREGSTTGLWASPMVQQSKGVGSAIAVQELPSDQISIALAGSSIARQQQVDEAWNRSEILSQQQQHSQQMFLSGLDSARAPGSTPDIARNEPPSKVHQF